MKNFGLLTMVIAFFLLTGTINAQISISDLSGQTADASAVLDVKSNSLGMLTPRLTTTQRTGISSPAEGLLVYDTDLNGFYVYDGGWSAVTPSIPVPLWIQTGGATELFNMNDFVGIGTTPGSAATKLHVVDNIGNPTSFIIDQNGPGSSYSALGYAMGGTGMGIFYTSGYDSGDQSYEISNTGSLTGLNTYSDPNTMYTINSKGYTGNPVDGITDINHQSRARNYQEWDIMYDGRPMFGQHIGFSPVTGWTEVVFNNQNYDEHGEFPIVALVPGGPQLPCYFTAECEGYYQVNARIDFLLNDIEDETGMTQIAYPNPDGYVSIAIFKGSAGPNPTWFMYAQGNNLQGADNIVTQNPALAYDLRNNLAPNISDVVYLQKGEKISIRAWQNLHPFNMAIPLKVSPVTDQSQIYVSIHKSS